MTNLSTNGAVRQQYIWYFMPCATTKISTVAGYHIMLAALLFHFYLLEVAVDLNISCHILTMCLCWQCFCNKPLVLIGYLITDHWKIGWVSILIIFLYNTKKEHFFMFTRSNKMTLFFYCTVNTVQENDRVYGLLDVQHQQTFKVCL